MSEERFPPAILEQIFTHPNVARMLDHLTIHKGFDYTVQELGKILEIPEIEVKDIVHSLKDDFDLVELLKKDGVRTYKIKDNEVTYLLRKFQFEIATRNMNKISKGN